MTPTSRNPEMQAILVSTRRALGPCGFERHSPRRRSPRSGQRGTPCRSHDRVQFSSCSVVDDRDTGVAQLAMNRNTIRHMICGRSARVTHARDGMDDVAAFRQRRYLADRESRRSPDAGELSFESRRGQRPSRADEDALHSGVSAGGCHLLVHATHALPTSPSIPRCFPRSAVRSSATA